MMEALDVKRKDTTSSLRRERLRVKRQACTLVACERAHEWVPGWFGTIPRLPILHEKRIRVELRSGGNAARSTMGCKRSRWCCWRLMRPWPRPSQIRLKGRRQVDAVYGRRTQVSCSVRRLRHGGGGGVSQGQRMVAAGGLAGRRAGRRMRGRARASAESYAAAWRWCGMSQG